METKVYVYTRADKQKSALESYKPNVIYKVENEEIEKIYERVED